MCFYVPEEQKQPLLLQGSEDCFCFRVAFTSLRSAVPFGQAGELRGTDQATRNLRSQRHPVSQK